MENLVDKDEKAEMQMELRGLKRRVAELEGVILDIQKNLGWPKRDASESPAPQRQTSRF